MLIYFIDIPADNDPKWALLRTMYQLFLNQAESKGIVVVVKAGDQVGTVILMRLSALYELTI
jgi:hypothetical protein